MGYTNPTLVRNRLMSCMEPPPAPLYPCWASGMEGGVKRREHSSVWPWLGRKADWQSPHSERSLGGAPEVTEDYSLPEPSCGRVGQTVWFVTRNWLVVIKPSRRGPPERKGAESWSHQAQRFSFCLLVLDFWGTEVPTSKPHPWTKCPEDFIG